MDKTLVNIEKSLIEDYQVSHIGQAIECEAPSIGKIAKELSPDKATGIIEKMLMDLCELLGQDMTKQQIQTTANIIYQDYKSLNMADMKLIISGYLKTEHYGAINANKVLTFINKYWDERLQAAAELSYQKHSEFIKPDREKPFNFSNNEKP